MRRRRVVRSALLAVVLATGVIVGLLGMHALDVHGTVHAAVGAHGPAVGAHAEHGSVSAAALAAAPSSGGALLSSSGCADCDAGGGMWAACVLALLAGLLLLLVPRAHRRLHPALSRLLPRELFADAAFPRPPSLIVLCISRT
ncbi:DUF6153 family protein [Microbacterium sp. OVT16B]|uniref:DUF6153 family protein n=1 Tax=Microbacterium sp. OVT16B TaxID=2862682 RepID=UPI001CBAD590|nr:DUF6153 family protein [Microbacterium sp. OVT16B]